MAFVKDICVDIFAKQDIGSTIYSKQGDGGLYYVKVKIMDSSKGEQIVLRESDHTVCISAKKPDKTVVLDDSEEHIYINEDGTVTLILTDQMQAVAGDEWVEVIVSDKASGTQITTATFINCIISRSVQDDDVKSTDYVPLLKELFSKASETYDDVKRYADTVDMRAAAAETAAEAASTAKNATEEAKEIAVRSSAKAAADASFAEKHKSDALAGANAAKASAEESARNAAVVAEHGGLFVMYSSSPDGTSHTSNWTEGQNYIGIATGKEAPADKSGYTWTRIADLVNVVQSEGESTTDAMSQKAVTKILKKVKDDLSRTTKEVANLKAGISPDFETDVSTAYVKDVPENVLPYAEVTRVGGMTYKSKNLFVASDVNETKLGLTIVSSGVYIKINGTKADGANVISVQNPNITIPAGTYTISCRMVGGTITGLDDGVFFGINRNTYSQRTTPGVCTTGVVGVRTITLNESTVISSFDIAPGYGGDGAVFSDALFEFQFESGEHATGYSEGFHGLQDTKVTEIESIGKNLIDIDDLYVNESNSYYVDIDLKYRIESQKTYTVSFDATSDIVPFNCIVAVGTNVANKYIGYLPNVSNGRNHITFSASTDDAEKYGYNLFLRPVAYGTATTFSATISNIQLEYGGIATEYSPCKKYKLPIPSAVQSLEGYGQGVDDTHYNYIEWADDNVKYVKKVKRIVLDGTEVISKYANETNTFYIDGGYNAYVDDTNYFGIAVCNHYIFSYTSGGNFTGTFRFQVLNGNRIYFYDFETELDAFKAKVASYYNTGDPIVIEYVTYETEITDITNMITGDNLIRVDPCDTITAVNEHKSSAPTSITYQLNQTTVSEEETA